MRAAKDPSLIAKPTNEEEEVLYAAIAKRLKSKPGWYDVVVEYFDQNNGYSHFEVLVNHQSVGTWTVDAWLPTAKPDSNSSTRKIFRMLALRAGDEIRIAGTPDYGERAAIDYIEIRPAGL